MANNTYGQITVYGKSSSKRKTKSGRHQLNLAEELKDILNEYSKELYENKEQALDKASDYLMEKLEQASPVQQGEGGGTFKNSWVRTHKYKGVRYIGNTDVGGKNKYGYSIPLSNLLEFSSKGRPFIRRTFDENKEQIIRIIKGELENGNSK